MTCGLWVIPCTTVVGFPVLGFFFSKIFTFISGFLNLFDGC
jgi:hypothetical protein